VAESGAVFIRGEHLGGAYGEEEQWREEIRNVL